MAQQRKYKLGEQLRRAIRDSGMSRYAICKATDLDEGAMSKFMHRKVGLSLAALERVVSFLNLELVKRPKRKSR